LAISIELGNKVRIVASLHGLGTIHQEQGDCHEALKKYVQALMLLGQLESPLAQIVGHSLRQLIEEMGKEAFLTAMVEVIATLVKLEAKASGGSETEAMSLGQMVDAVVRNTMAAMTEEAESREE
jgi:hypothetical protein